MPFGSPARPATAAPAAAPPVAAPPAVSNFQRSAAPAAGPPPAARPPVPAGTSRWAGVQQPQDREPKLDLGYYRVRFMGAVMGRNPNTFEETYKGYVEIVLADPASNPLCRVGEKRAVIHKLAGKAAMRNSERAKAMLVATAGYDNWAEYNAFDPEGGFIDSVTGIVTANSQTYAPHFTLVGRLADVRVTRGNDIMTVPKDGTAPQPTGDYWREYAWAVVPENEQEAGAPPKPAWAAT